MRRPLGGRAEVEGELMDRWWFFLACILGEWGEGISMARERQCLYTAGRRREAVKAGQKMRIGCEWRQNAELMQG